MKTVLRTVCAMIVLASLALPVTVLAQNLTHGPVVGAVTPTSAAFVYRVDAPADLQMELSTDPGFASSVMSTTAPTVADSDFFGLMSIDGLTANTLYYYRPVINGTPVEDGITRSFRTFPEDNATSEYVMLMGSCQQDLRDPRSGFGFLFNEMAEEPALFFLQQGDWTYPDTTTTPQNPFDFWSLDYGRVQASVESRYTPNYPMINLMRKMPVAYTYDDHDMVYDNSDHFQFPWPAIRNAIRGEQYLFPAYPMPNPDGGVWQSFRCGSAEYFLTDNRAERSPNVMGFSYNIVGAETTWTFNPPPEKSILNGDPSVTPGQMAWLEDALLNSTATWKFVSTGTMFNPGARAIIELALMLQHSQYDPVFFPGEDRWIPLYQIAIEFADKWAGFPETIRELVCFVREHNIQNVILLTGDSHNAGVDDGANAVFPELMSSGLDKTNSGEVALAEQFGIFIWDKGGHVSGLPPEAYGNSFGRVSIFGSDSVRLEAVAEGGQVLGATTVSAGFMPDDVHFAVAPYGLNFGDVLLCRAPAVQAFIALSTSCGAVEVQSITSTDPHFMLPPGFPTSFTIESGQKMLVPVLYFPTAGEVNQGALVVMSNDPQAPTLVLLQGQGVVPDTCEIAAGIYRTENHGGWGQDCHGNNIGCLRDARFAAAFPTGLVVGGQFTLTLTTSQAVADLLPTGGRAGVFTENYVDPEHTSAGNFAGPVVALAVNVGFGQLGIAGFGDMRPLVIASGPFMHYTVEGLLTLANTVIGGDLSALPAGTSIEDLRQAVSLVNDNFMDGTSSNGFLLDPCCWPDTTSALAKVRDAGQDVSLTPPASYTLENYPNPFNPSTEIAFSLKDAGLARLAVYNVLGQQVAMLVNDMLPAGRHLAKFDGTMLPSGLYFYRLEANGQMLQKKMLLLK